MNRINRGMTCLILINCVVGFSINAWADDAPADQPVKSHGQLMKECMAKQAASHSGATQKAMKATCNDELTSYHNHPSAKSPSTAPPER